VAKKRVLITILIITTGLIIGPFQGYAQFEGTDDSEKWAGEPLLADLFIARPLGLIKSVLGMVGFVVTIPLTVPFGSTRAAFDLMVREPFSYTFQRPLGTNEDFYYDFESKE
jgi:hypothetical protein